MAAEIDVKPVRSRDIALIGYDHHTGTLEIVFRAGGVYRYQDVPENVYHSLMSSASHGTYFQNHIKHKYSFLKAS